MTEALVVSELGAPEAKAKMSVDFRPRCSPSSFSELPLLLWLNAEGHKRDLDLRMLCSQSSLSRINRIFLKNNTLSS